MKKEFEGKTFAGFAIEWASTSDKKWAVKAAPTTIKTRGRKGSRSEGRLRSARRI